MRVNILFSFLRVSHDWRFIGYLFTDWGRSTWVPSLSELEWMFMRNITWIKVIKLKALSVFKGWSSSPGPQTETWTLLISICSPVHLWNSPLVPSNICLKLSWLKIGQIEHFLLTNQMPGSIPLPTGRPSSRQAGRTSAFMVSQPMGAQRCDPTRPVLCAVCYVSAVAAESSCGWFFVVILHQYEDGSVAAWFKSLSLYDLMMFLLSCCHDRTTNMIPLTSIVL